MRIRSARLAAAAAFILALTVLAAALLKGATPATRLLELPTSLGRGALGALLAAVLACGAAALALWALAKARTRERAAAESRTELERERSRLDAVLRLLPTGVMIADPSGKLLHANEEARRIWGGRSRNGAPATYRTCRARRPDTGEPLGPNDWGVQRVLRTGEAAPLELIEIDRFDGTRGQVLSGAALVRGKDGAPLGAVAVLQDVATFRRAAAWSPEAALRPSACDPHDLLADAAELLRAHVQGRGLELTVGAEPNLPWVHCDREQVVHALVSLAASAAGATSGGALHLEARVRGGTVEFHVHGGEPHVAGPAPRRPRGPEPRSSGACELTFSLPCARAIGASPLGPPGSTTLRPPGQGERQAPSAGSSDTREPSLASRPGRWPDRLP